MVKEDGGFAWTKDLGSDGDMTAMTLQALSNHQDREDKSCKKSWNIYLKIKKRWWV